MKFITLQKGAFTCVSTGTCKGLPPEAQTLYMWLMHFRNTQTGKCFPSLNRLIGTTGMCKKTIIKYLKVLENHGCIKKHKRVDIDRGNLANQYDVLIFEAGDEEENDIGNNEESDKKVQGSSPLSSRVSNIPPLVDGVHQPPSGRRGLPLVDGVHHNYKKIELKEDLNKEKIEKKERKGAIADAAEPIPQTPFEKFWLAYPIKVGRKEAKEVFEEINPGEELLVKMLAAIEQQRKEKALKRNRKIFVSEWPNAKKWLTDQRWEDEVDFGFMRGSTSAPTQPKVEKKFVLPPDWSDCLAWLKELPAAKLQKKLDSSLWAALDAYRKTQKPKVLDALGPDNLQNLYQIYSYESKLEKTRFKAS